MFYLRTLDNRKILNLKKGIGLKVKSMQVRNQKVWKQVKDGA